MNEQDGADDEAGTAGEGGTQGGGPNASEDGKDEGTKHGQSGDGGQPSKCAKILVPGTRKTAK